MATALKKPPNGGGVFACQENQLVSHPCMQTHIPDYLWCGQSFFGKFVRRWTAQKG